MRVLVAALALAPALAALAAPVAAAGMCGSVVERALCDVHRAEDAARVAGAGARWCLFHATPPLLGPDGLCVLRYHPPPG